VLLFIVSVGLRTVKILVPQIRAVAELSLVEIVIELTALRIGKQ
jgi:hypothetical protein